MYIPDGFAVAKEKGTYDKPWQTNNMRKSKNRSGNCNGYFYILTSRIKCHITFLMLHTWLLKYYGNINGIYLATASPTRKSGSGKQGWDSSKVTDLDDIWGDTKVGTRTKTSKGFRSSSPTKAGGTTSWATRVDVSSVLTRF